MKVRKILKESLNVSAEIMAKAEKAVAEAWKRVTGLDFDLDALTMPALRDLDTGDTAPIDYYESGALKKITEMLAIAYLAPSIAGKSIKYQYGYGSEIVGTIPDANSLIDAIRSYYYHIPAVNIKLNDTKLASPFTVEQKTIKQIVGCTGVNEEDVLIFLAALTLLNPIETAQNIYFDAKRDDYQRHKKEEDKIAKRQAKADANLKEIEAAIASGALKNADGYWGALGYLAAAVDDSRVVTRISATVPEAKPGKIDWVTWFDNNYPDDLDALNIRKVLKKKSAISGKEWDNIYGPIFELHISKKAVSSAPEFLFSGLAGTANPIFASKSDTAGALREDGTISNLVFIAKLVNDHGFKFSAPYVPTLEELLATVPDQYKDAVKAGYDKGVAVLKAYDVSADDDDEVETTEVSDDADLGTAVDALDLSFPDPDDSSIIGPEDFDESFDEEDYPDDPFVLDYENELFSAEANAKARAEVDAIRAEEDEDLDEDIGNTTFNKTIKLAKEYRKAFKK